MLAYGEYFDCERELETKMLDHGVVDMSNSTKCQKIAFKFLPFYMGPEV